MAAHDPAFIGVALRIGTVSTPWFPTPLTTR